MSPLLCQHRQRPNFPHPPESPNVGAASTHFRPPLAIAFLLTSQITVIIGLCTVRLICTAVQLMVRDGHGSPVYVEVDEGQAALALGLLYPPYQKKYYVLACFLHFYSRRSNRFSTLESFFVALLNTTFGDL